MDDDKYSIRSLADEAGTRMVRAWVKKGDGLAYAMTFPVGAIDGLIALNEAASGIVLRSGVKIPVLLPQAELQKKIYSSDLRNGQAEINLLDVTVDAYKQVTMPGLAKKFNEEKAEEKVVETVEKPKGLKIYAVLRKEGSYEFMPCEFYESDIQSFSAQRNSQAKSGFTVLVQFNTAAKSTHLPFTKAYIDMPHDDFVDLYTRAKTNGLSQLDLCKTVRENSGKYGFKIT
jgi:hypothetical protein